MAKFVRNNSSGKLEVSIRRISHERNQDVSRNLKIVNSRSYVNNKISEDWVKVVFNEAPEFDPEWIQEELQKAATGSHYEKECSLQIFNYRVAGENAIVFVKLSQVSFDTFKRNCYKIPHPTTGQACDVVILTAEFPEVPVNLPEKWVACIKETLAQRYISSENSLNLSKFSEDDYLNSQNLWLSLTRPVIVRAIATLLRSVDNIFLNSLNISHNNLNHVTHLAPIFEALPVFGLDISDNYIIHRSFISLLNSATSLRRLTMFRDGGMSGQKLKNKKAFIQELIENCQSLEMFNNEDLRTDIFGGILRLPSSKQSTNVNDKLMMDFFTDHASKIEADRDLLVDYYCSDSVLNASVCYHDLTTNNRRFSEVYMKNSRNLERLKDVDRRNQFIKHGSAQILGFFSEIPKLRHIPTSFSLDVIVNTDESKIFTVNGLFVECCKITQRNKLDNRDAGTGSGHNYFNMRMFSRSLIVIPPGKILQENWTVTNPTDVQFRKYRQQFEDLKVLLESDKVERKIQVKQESLSSNSNLSLALPQQQEASIQSLIQYSGMNRNFSLQCLQETDWNIEKAKEIFQQAFTNGKIPPEAFLK